MEYAHLNRHGNVAWTSSQMRHPAMLPVDRNEPTEDQWEYHIQRKPKDQWIVEADKVIITYTVRPKDLRLEIRQAIERANERKDRALAAGVPVTVQAGTFTFDSTERSINLVAQAQMDVGNRPTRWKQGKRWRMKEGWVKIHPADIKTIMSAVAEHTETVFSWFEKAETTLVTATSVRELRQMEQDLSKELPDGEFI